MRWAFSSSIDDEVAAPVLEFVRDRVLEDPDFGEVVNAHTRGDVATGTDIEVIWTFDPDNHTVEIITPIPDD